MLGVEVAWHKASRGMSCTWIGVLFTLSLQKMHLLVMLPEQTLAGLRSEASAITQQSVVSYARLRRFTGKLSWVSGVLPRTRWIIRVV